MIPQKSFAAAIFVAVSATLSGQKKPNVLLICIDDLKPMLGCYGDKTVKTPNIDRLAERSTLFENAYCNQAVCAPSRNALLTGLRPDTIGVYDLDTNFRLATPDVKTLPQIFKESGYHAAGIGKVLHVGHGNVDDPASWSMKSWRPSAPLYALKESNSPTAPQGYGDRGHSTESADVPDGFYADGKIAGEAISRLQQMDDKPFFLAVGFIKPHLPFVAPKKYWDLHDAEKFTLAEARNVPEGAPSFAPQFGGELHKYGDIPDGKVIPDEIQRRLIHGYHAATSYVDAQIGRVLEALEENDLTKNTIVVLWGDHGWHLGDHGMWCKHTNYEQAARIPLLIAKPGAKSGSGMKSTAFAETVDIYPTLCELADIIPPGKLDGISLVNTLGNAVAKSKEHVIHVYPRRNILGRAIRTKRYRFVEWKVPGAARETAELELYDYERDPLETKNIAAENPEAVSELRAILSKYPEAKPQFKPNATKAEKPAVDRNKLFDYRDMNKDGKLTMEEFLRKQPDGEKARSRFPRFDKNDDEFLSREEFVKP